MHGLLQDLRFGLRTLLRSPGFTAIAVMTLALGIGANTVIFSLLNSALLTWSDCVRDPDGLVMVFQSRSDTGRWGVTPADFRDWRERNRSFEQIGAYTYTSLNLSGTGEPDRVLAAPISASLFPLLGVAPARGRLFTEDEEQWGRHRVVLLSDAIWRSRFGADPAVLGGHMTLDGQPHTIVGVLPPGAWFASTRADLWIPLAFAPGDPTDDRNSHFLWTVARLKPGVGLAGARDEMRRIAARLEREHKENAGLSSDVMKLRDVVLGPIEPVFLALAAAVGFVLLIVCANIANLLLARGASRTREIALRTALGAGRGRIVRQLLSESALLGLVGGLAGLVLALWGTDLAAALLPEGVPRLHEVAVRVDGRVLLFTLALSLTTSLIFGLAPAFRISRVDPLVSLKEGGRGAGPGPHGRRIHRLLIVSEVALTLVLLAGAGLFLRSFVRLQRVDLGFRRDHTLTLRIELPAAVQLDARKTAEFFEKLLQRVESVPGIRAAGVTTHLPLGGGGQSRYFFVEGRPLPSRLEEVPIISARQESAGTLDALGVPQVAGRRFTDRDSTGALPVAIINRTLARTWFPGEDPLGRQIVLESPEPLTPARDLPSSGRFTRWTVVGVVGDVRYRGPGDPPEPIVYVPYLQRTPQMPWAPAFLVIRTAGDPLAMAPLIRDLVWSVDRSQSVSNVATLEEIARDALRQPRFVLILLGTFAAAALALAAIGIYGVAAFSVSQRTHEMGVRIALGARSSAIVRLVVGESIRWVLVGVVIGLASSVALMRLLPSLVFGTRPTDPAALLCASLLLATVAAVASYFPARRATRVDPMVALRYE